MKKLITSLFTFYCIGLGFGQNSWQNLTPDPSASFVDLAIADSNNCFAVGWQGVAYKTNNGGSSWTAMQTGTIDDLTSVCVIGDVVYATSPQEAKILRSSDGQIFSASSLNGYHGNSVYFFNNLVGFVTGGEKGKISKTSNGGDSWQVIETSYQSVIKKVHFVTTTNGFGIAHEMNNNIAKCVILKTSDGGTTWQQVYEEQNVVLNDISFTDASYGYFVGNNGKIIRTNDGGATFTSYATGLNVPLKAVSFSDNFVGYVVGINGTVLKTTNRGATWINISVTKKYPLEAIEFQGSVGYALVSGNRILKSLNGGL